jgi:hypothetical protein
MNSTNYQLSESRANFGKGKLRRRMKLPANGSSFVKKSAALVASNVIFFSLVITISSAALAAPQASGRVLEPADMQNLIFVWASGTSSIQQKALQICQTALISARSCAQISEEVRSAWLDLMQIDPASLGRIGVQTNPAGRAQVYEALAGKLSSLTQGKESLLLAQTQKAMQQLNAFVQQANNHLMPEGTRNDEVKHCLPYHLAGHILVEHQRLGLDGSSQSTRQSCDSLDRQPEHG